MFKSHLDMRHVEGTELYKLLRNLIYITWDKTKWIVPKDYKSDGHSIPKLLRSFAGSPFGTKYPKSAWVHDFLCWQSALGRITRKRADIIYKQAMEDEGASGFQQVRNYIGVRIGAFFGGIARWIRRR